MAARSIASLSLSFGLVSIPVKVYSATESSAAIRFKLMTAGGGRLKQQYVSEPDIANAPVFVSSESDHEEATAPAATTAAASAARSRAAETVVDLVPGRAGVGEPPEPSPSVPSPVVERSEIVKGYEFATGEYVLFDAEELKALQAESRQTIDIVSFIPSDAVDPIYYDKAYFLAPDKRGAKPYSLLVRAMQVSRRTALAKWAWRSKEYVVQLRPIEGGMVLQQLLYADEVRDIGDLRFDLSEVGEGELKLAKQLIEQTSADAYDPNAFVDEEKQRILAAVERKIQGQRVATAAEPAPRAASNVVDLMEALRNSLASRPTGAAKTEAPSAVDGEQTDERKPVRRAVKAKEPSKAARTGSKK